MRKTYYDIELRFPCGCMTDSAKVRIQATSLEQALRLAVQKTRATSMTDGPAIKPISAHLAV